MADTELTYTPEELAEIQRIMDVIGTLYDSPAVPPPGRTVQPLRPAPLPQESEATAAPLYSTGYGSEPGSFNDIPLDALDDIPQADFAMTPDDITPDIAPIEEIDEQPEGDTIAELEPLEIEPEIEPLPASPQTRRRRSSTAELDALTKDEPESLDDDEIAKDGFTSFDFETDDADYDIAATIAADMTDIDTTYTDTDDTDTEMYEASDDQLGELSEMEFETGPDDISQENYPDMDTISMLEDDKQAPPNLDELNFDDDDATIPDAMDIDVDSLSSDLDAIADEIIDTSPGDDTISEDDTISDEEDDTISDEFDIGLDIQGDDIDLPAADDNAYIPDVDIDDSLPEELQSQDTDDFVIEPIDDDEPKATSPADKAATQLGISEKDLKKLRKAMELFNPGLKNTIIDAVINDLLTEDDTQTLIDLIIGGHPEPKLRSFLEERLDIEIPELPEIGTTGRRVLHSRPEYMKEGRERQKKRLKALAIIAGGAFITFVITILSYEYIYKPIMAKRKISEGVELIVRPGDYESKPADYRTAEEIAAYVDENYVKNYIYGYIRYANAYLNKKEYQRAYSKLNTVYRIAPQNIDVLLSLGSFYSKIPGAFYSTVRSSIGNNYYPPDDNKNRDMSQLDLAINFYKRVLTINPKEIRAYQGIGNAYFIQGQYLKAKNFYMDILKISPDSIIGYSGLMNLYIERDSYDLVASTHAELKYKNLLQNLPKPLLAKLASYYLTKNKSDSFNVRVDYGVQSKSLKDIDDNSLPAVRSILSILNSIDSSYPPLMFLLAKLNLFENNIKAADRYLDRAINKAPEYFDALHLKGKISYETNQPVKAYKFLTRAVNNYANLPDFAEEDFYKGTENLGESYAILGNIFYYFFDKVRYRFGDLDDEILGEELEKMANYNIAKEKYELAVKENFGASEVYYNLGRINYLNRQYTQALEQWLHLYDDFVTNPELMLSLGNAFFHIGQYDASKSEFLKLINVLEYEADKITVVDRSSYTQMKIFKTLATAYNNIGAVYQIKNDESKSGISYWKAIDYAARLGVENEFARVNNARYFNNNAKADPILDENLPYSIKYYSADMR